ncbi:hypothetical protein QVZ41_02715 [Wenyingzhuangia sp. chi5]|uniref:LPP20 lipoprotein n=1 Tax=Wenyingzhuangia gilva TaxID=3057677 RepID=A0ABT8VP68_9FLAO|nr:hypothetical protein [Wenyingzhuangia sp. chi5]MDO3693759.1 hypothetical protein [Wenyingzhuangia sp. chi5]
MKKIICLVFVLMSMNFYAQQITEVKLKTKDYNLKKAKKQNKIFINSFSVYFEIYKEVADSKQGYKGTRGKVTGDAKVRLGVGLKGVDIDAVQAKTDLLYQETITKIKEKGFELVGIEEAKKIEFFEDYLVGKGPFMIEQDHLPGVIQSVPSGYSFMYKDPKKTELGKAVNKLTSKFNFSQYSAKQNISKDLGDVMVMDINMYVMFTEQPKGGFKLPSSLDKVAKVKIVTNLRLIDNYTVVKSADTEKMGLLGSLGSKGAAVATDVISSVDIVYGKNKIGGSPLASYTGGLKDPVEILGVMKKDKISAYQRQQTISPSLNSSAYQNIGGISLATVENRFSKNASWIEVDGEKYSEGLYNVCHVFLEENMKEIFD